MRAREFTPNESAASVAPAGGAEMSEDFPVVGPSRFCWSLYVDIFDLPDYDSLAPEQRQRTLPQWATLALVTSQPAVRRLKAWVAAAAREYSEAEREAFIAAARVETSATMRPHVDAVLRRLPPPVFDHIVRNVHMTVVGPGAPRGYAVGLYLRADQTEMWACTATLVVDPAMGMDITPAQEIQGTIAHEYLHTWLLRQPLVGARPVRAEELAEARRYREYVAALHVETGQIEEMTEPREIDEAQCCALVKSLGFRGVGADGHGCILGVRAGVEREAREAWKRHLENTSSLPKASHE
jgi:hypothetical protein